MAWVRANGPRGGATDIATPLNWALSSLKASTAGQVAAPRMVFVSLRRSLLQPLLLPFVFLLTDGAVDNEREICR